MAKAELEAKAKAEAEAQVAPGVVAAAARVLAGAEQVVVTAGAGMGVDSGLPDFRGDEGFWNAYPPYRALGLSFVEMANPGAFVTDPAFAWGFYGHRRALYRETTPHAGFAILREWVQAAPYGGAVITSNVDGHFHTSGFDPDRIWEVHGTLRLDQCLVECGHPAFPGSDPPPVDSSTMRATGPLPTCPGCGGTARPNVLMFGDFGWDGTESGAQQQRVAALLREPRRRVVVELGAGTGLPTIRRISEDLARQPGSTLIRINPRESAGPPGTLSLPTGALAGLEAIAAT